MAPKDYLLPQLIPLIPFIVGMGKYVKPNNPGWGYGAKKIITDNWPPPYSLPPDFESPEWAKQPAPAPQGIGELKPMETNWNRQDEERAKDYITDIVYPWG